jgi:small redox-active disulfide protein 2
MKIKVIGSGCPTCKKLHEMAKEAVKEAGIDAEIEYSTNVQEIVEMGLVHGPILTVDGKLVEVKSFSVEGVKEAILENNCGDNCCSDKDCC